MANTSEKMGKYERDAIEKYRGLISWYSAETIPAEVKYEKVGEYAERLQKTLDDKGMSATELAKESGVSAQALSQILLGKLKTVNIDRARLFAAILGCTPHYLLGLTNNPDKSLTTGGAVIVRPIQPAMQVHDFLYDCLKDCNDLEFVRCVAEVVKKSKTDKEILYQAKQLWINGGKCDPSKFEVIIPSDWHFDEGVSLSFVGEKEFEEKCDK